MLVYKSIPLSFLLRLNWKYLLTVLFLGFGTWYLSVVLHIQNTTTLLPSAAVFGAILSIFLAFRTNEAYSRWWEARTLWGQLVNSSRSFVRELIAFMPEDAPRDNSVDRMVMRHLAFVNALRISLRNQTEEVAMLGIYLSNEEFDSLKRQSNIPTQIIKNQTMELKEVYKRNSLGTYEYVQLNTTLNKLYDIQGGCERIKNTVFPRLYSYYTTAFTWIFAVLLIVSLVDEFDWQIMIVRMLVAYVFLLLNNLGISLKNPFENQFDDTPMTALCRTIEIDLREMIGQHDHQLQPTEPEDGTLL